MSVLRALRCAHPWEELEWVGSDITLGDVSCRVDRRNGRCGATNVNPLTGERDMDIPGALRKRFGHKDLGIYLVAREVPSAVPARRSGNFICRGCYCVYEEGKRAARGLLGPFEQVGDDWCCPDCGTTKANFRPYLPELTEPSPRAAR